MLDADCNLTTETPPLPDECEDLYSTGANELMNPMDQDVVKQLIAQSKKGFPGWAKESLAFAIVMAGAAFIVTSYFPTLIESHTKTLSNDIATLRSDIASVKESTARIDRNVESLLGKAFDKLLQAPSVRAQSKGAGPKESAQIKSDIEFGQSLIQTARTVKYRTASGPVISVGRAIMEAGRRHPDLESIVWLAVKDFAEYRSFLSTFEAPPLPAGEVRPATYYWIARSGSLPIPHATAIGLAPVEQRAIFQQIDNPTMPQATMGNKLFVLNGGAITLDNLEARHVRLSNVEVHYSGKPTRLTDVSFVNCTFVVDRSDNGILLMQALLSVGSTDANIG